MPIPELGCGTTAPSVQTSFVDKMGLTWPQATALMGVHTLGRTMAANSGLQGWWSDPTNQGVFNNDYYISLIAKGWTKRTQSSGKVQWNREDIAARSDAENGGMPEMMLTSDLCLFFNTDTLSAAIEGCCAWNHNGGVPNGSNQAPPSLPHCGSTRGAANSFSDDFENCCPKGTNGQECIHADNPAGKAAETVRQYARDENLFLNDFKTVWKKVTEWL